MRPPVSTFQFHTGSIKSYEQPKPLIANFGFNSTLVRLKGCRLEIAGFVQCGFNSTLVRLKVGTNCFNCKARKTVSIPHWFD